MFFILQLEDYSNEITLQQAKENCIENYCADEDSSLSFCWCDMEFIEDLINEPSCIDVWYSGNILDQCHCLESINESLENICQLSY